MKIKMLISQQFNQQHKIKYPYTLFSAAQYTVQLEQAVMVNGIIKSQVSVRIAASGTDDQSNIRLYKQLKSQKFLKQNCYISHKILQSQQDFQYLFDIQIRNLRLNIQIIPANSIPSRSQYWGFSFSSQASLVFSFGVITLMESQGDGFDASSLTTTINNYSISIAWTWHMINIIVYLVLAIYLDQVFPNEWGVKKHPLFFINWIWQKNRVDRISHSSMTIERMNTHDDKFEEVEQALKEQEQKNEALIINGLYRTYPNGKQAVSNLNLSMYQGQIFALLGHNGAGKTSTISMLTGLLEITKGDVIGYGFDVKTQLQELRKIMGVCPQHDILFDNLTVKEHLELFAQFKGMKSSEEIIFEFIQRLKQLDYLQSQIKQWIILSVTKIIADVDLTDKTDYLSKNLSGGQKRRLSVAIAFIGNSKLVYLDEPTSGMDTSARRYIWEMLKNYCQNNLE